MDIALTPSATGEYYERYAHRDDPPTRELPGWLSGLDEMAMWEQVERDKEKAKMELATKETNEAYHSDVSHLSASMLKTLDESPALFEASYITRTYKRPDTADQKLGRAVHGYVLQRDRFEEMFPIMPDYHLMGNVDSKGKASTSKSTTYYQDRKREFEAANRGRDIIDADDLRTVKSLANAIWDHADAREILESGNENEVIHRWHNRVPRRCMKDAPRPALGLCADIKTIQGRPTARNFATTAAKFRWFLQAPYYLDAMNDLYGPSDYRFLFIVVGKAEPHEVAIHELTPEDLEWAAGRVEELVSELIARRETGNWQGAYQRGINSTPLPAYVKSKYYDVED